MDKYSIILKNDKAKTYTIFTSFILLLNFLLFGYIYFNSIDSRLGNLSLWGTVISAFSLTWAVINRFTSNRYPFPFEVSFFILAVLWFMVDKYLLALCIVGFAIIGIYTRRKLQVVFADSGIQYPSFPKKLISWKEVSNVVLKDGMLTIDLRNNTLIQAPLTTESTIAVNEREFNLFCKARIPGSTTPQSLEEAS